MVRRKEELGNNNGDPEKDPRTLQGSPSYILKKEGDALACGGNSHTREKPTSLIG